MAVMAVDVDGPAAVQERLEEFGAEVLAEAVNRPVQVVNGGLYMRGLIEQGPRKSLEPMVARLGGEADYESLQNFLAVSPWDPAAVVRASAERVTPEIGVEAWVLDDTGFPKDGKASPGVKRQYSGTLGTRPTARTPGCVTASTRPAASTCSRSGRGRRCSHRAPPSRCPRARAIPAGRGPTPGPTAGRRRSAT